MSYLRFFPYKNFINTGVYGKYFFLDLISQNFAIYMVKFVLYYFI